MKGVLLGPGEEQLVRRRLMKGVLLGPGEEQLPSIVGAGLVPARIARSAMESLPPAIRAGTKPCPNALLSPRPRRPTERRRTSLQLRDAHSSAIVSIFCYEQESSLYWS